MEGSNLNDQFKSTHEEFLSTMLFFLRTPVIAVDGYSKILAVGVDGSLNPKQTFFVETIRRSTGDLQSLLDVFGYVIRFDTNWWQHVYNTGLSIENISIIVEEAIKIRTSFGSLRIDDNIEILIESTEDLPDLKLHKEILIAIIRLMVMSAVYASHPCSKILIESKESGKYVDLHIISNSNNSNIGFEDLQPKYPFHNIYDSITLEFKEAQKEEPSHFYPFFLAVAHGLSTIHGTELRMKLSKPTSEIVLRIPTTAG
jgi:hypothetical protein